jgi:hypothetical protein
MRKWKTNRVVFAMIAAAGLLLPVTTLSQVNTGLVGSWTQVSGSVTHDYAFTSDGRYESKVYGSIVYQINRGTYTVQGDQLTMSAPQAAPEIVHWKIVKEYGRPTLKMTDSFGATVSFYWERFDQRYAAGTFIPYEKASLPGYWIVNHGHLHWEYAFTPDGKFQSKRVGDAINETVRGTYTVKGNILILASPDKPLQGFVWRMELENGARTLILVDTYGAFEVYYESKAGT